MQKVTSILFLITITYSCSIIRKGDNVDYRLLNVDETERKISKLREQNLTENGFFIQKAEIEIFAPEGNKKVIGIIKYEKPDKYLISIKSRAGIEAVRIFISSDTILVNDRINKKILYGSPDYLRDKYGITNNLFAVVLGDYFSENISEMMNYKCLNGKMDLKGEVGDVEIKYLVDCKKNKVIFASSDENLVGNQIEIRFDDFTKTGNILSARKIEIKELKTKTNIIIRIKKIEYPWNGSNEFIPGNRYEIRRLL